ncbi:MAG: hypothetical protein GWN18_12585, partial [Thermoplasmata archaeon]|nr:hypothetical protein [Thermoplasmata archaeon]NIT76840.1 hypothetical protein [Thermoplasmata archaeon]NIW83369.1 hypothetical protein [Thermoplasmata archaeon]NIW89611.1 hypothetical protein [Thermoplasmata archaeon]NIY03211.1 hypothetical protein [Thermoplasmata archaeon]
ARDLRHGEDGRGRRRRAGPPAHPHLTGPGGPGDGPRRDASGGAYLRPLRPHPPPERVRGVSGGAARGDARGAAHGPPGGPLRPFFWTGFVTATVTIQGPVATWARISITLIWKGLSISGISGG